jgi:rSAM/selenodomain-associated transferase 1
MNRAVIIMAKVPVVGTVKTRLQSVFSPEKCAELAAAFLLDSVKKAKTVCENVILAYSPDSQRKLLESIISDEIILVEQKGENLGEKMSNAFEFAFSENTAVVMIGTDSPTFPADYITKAFEALEKDSEIVLGKAKDGGFYLIGLRKSIPKLFDEIAWSTPVVFEQISGNIKNLGIAKLKLIPEHYDVDTPVDFLMMKTEILGDKNSQKSAEKTYQWLLVNIQDLF